MCQIHLVSILGLGFLNLGQLSIIGTSDPTKLEFRSLSLY